MPIRKLALNVMLGGDWASWLRGRIWTEEVVIAKLELTEAVQTSLEGGRRRFLVMTDFQIYGRSKWIDEIAIQREEGTENWHMMLRRKVGDVHNERQKRGKSADVLWKFSLVSGFLQFTPRCLPCCTFLELVCRCNLW